MDRRRHLQRACTLLFLALVSIALLAVTSTRGAAQDSTTRTKAAAALPSYRFRVLGVFDDASGQPVPNADVTNILTGGSAKTSATGTVALTFLPDGGGLVRIRKLGYAMRTMMVEIAPADTVPVTVVLEPAVQLPGVTTYGTSDYISPNLRAFEERKRIGMGYYIDEKALRKAGDMPLASVLLRHIPGINISPERATGERLGPSPRCVSGGPPAVYLDGVRIHYFPPPTPQLFARLRSGKGPPTTGPIDVSQFETWGLGGVEYYPDQNIAPMEFSGTSDACGVLLLWTREK